MLAPVMACSLQKSPEAFRLVWNTLNHAERPAGERLYFAVSSEIVNAFVHKLKAGILRKHRRKPRLDNGRIRLIEILFHRRHQPLSAPHHPPDNFSYLLRISVQAYRFYLHGPICRVARAQAAAESPCIHDQPKPQQSCARRAAAFSAR